MPPPRLGLASVLLLGLRVQQMPEVVKLQMPPDSGWGPGAPLGGPVLKACCLPGPLWSQPVSLHLPRQVMGKGQVKHSRGSQGAPFPRAAKGREPPGSGPSLEDPVGRAAQQPDTAQEAWPPLCHWIVSAFSMPISLKDQWAHAPGSPSGTYLDALLGSAGNGPCLSAGNPMWP